MTACPPPGTSFSGELGLVCVLPDDIDKACFGVLPRRRRAADTHSSVSTQAFKVTLTVGDGVATSDFDAGSDADMG